MAPFGGCFEIVHNRKVYRRRGATEGGRGGGRGGGGTGVVISGDCI
jgi:hypothetical protein